MPLPETRRELRELLQEAKYYCVQELMTIIEQEDEKRYKKKPDEVEPICRVPLITSPREEQSIVTTSTKVIRGMCCTGKLPGEIRGYFLKNNH